MRDFVGQPKELFQLSKLLRLKNNFSILLSIVQLLLSMATERYGFRIQLQVSSKCLKIKAGRGTDTSYCHILAHNYLRVDLPELD